MSSAFQNQQLINPNEMVQGLDQDRYQSFYSGRFLRIHQPDLRRLTEKRRGQPAGNDLSHIRQESGFNPVYTVWQRNFR